MIKEVIVVEGRDDITAVKRAVQAEVIATGGFSLPPRVMERIKLAAKKKGIIIFTDPDYAGEKIRRIISSQVPDAKHAFLPKLEVVPIKLGLPMQALGPLDLILYYNRMSCTLNSG